jgi:endonuclease YncB( thermonuclease family)
MGEERQRVWRAEGRRGVAVNPRDAPILIALLALTGMSHQPQKRLIGQIASVTDGDTFRLATGERIRIAGIDAPEVERGQARCRSEIEQGLSAKALATRLLEGQTVKFVRVGRSYRRTVALVWLGRKSLSSELIRIGAARPWPHHAPKPDWCAH